MAVTTFHDFPLAPRDRAWNGAAAEKRMRAWAGAQDKPNGKYRDAHLWYDAASKQNFTAYKLLFTYVVDGRQVAVPRAIFALVQAALDRGLAEATRRLTGSWPGEGDEQDEPGKDDAGKKG